MGKLKPEVLDPEGESSHQGGTRHVYTVQKCTGESRSATDVGLAGLQGDGCRRETGGFLNYMLGLCRTVSDQTRTRENTGEAISFIVNLCTIQGSTFGGLICFGYRELSDGIGQVLGQAR